MTKTAPKAAQSANTTRAKPGPKTAVKTAAKPAPKTPARKPATTPATPARAARSAVRTARVSSVDAAEPSLRFHHSRALRAKTNAVLAALEAAPERAHHGEALADLVTELIEVGMDYYFMRALTRTQMGFVAEQSARIGLSGASKLISSVSRKFIVRMDQRQLLIVAQHIRELG
jgi:hypothetical protein